MSELGTTLWHEPEASEAHASRFLKKLLGAPSTEELAAKLAAEIVNQGYKQSVVIRLSADRDATVLIAAAGSQPLPHPSQRIPLSRDPYTRKVIDARRPIRFSETDAQTYGVDPWNALLGTSAGRIHFPVIVSEEIIGVVVVAFAEHDLLKNFGVLDQLVAAYSDVLRLVLRIEADAPLATASEQLRLVDRNLSALLNHTAESGPRIDGLLQSLAERVVAITGAELCDITIARSGMFLPIGQSGPLAGVGRPARENDHQARSSLSMRAIQSGRNIIQLGKRTDSFYLQMLAAAEEGHQRQNLQAVRAWGAFPIFAGQPKAIGALAVCSSDWDFFVSWRTAVLELFAEKAALVLAAANMVASESIRLTTEKHRVSE